MTLYEIAMELIENYDEEVIAYECGQEILKIIGIDKENE